MFNLSYRYQPHSRGPCGLLKKLYKGSLLALYKCLLAVHLPLLFRHSPSHALSFLSLGHFDFSVRHAKLFVRSRSIPVTFVLAYVIISAANRACRVFCSRYFDSSLSRFIPLLLLFLRMEAVPIPPIFGNLLFVIVCIFPLLVFYEGDTLVDSSIFL